MPQGYGHWCGLDNNEQKLLDQWMFFCNDEFIK